PSLADFALFGGNAAHFTNDPLCRRWVEEEGPAVVQHTDRLLEPEDQAFGAWDDPAAVPDTLTAVLAELGKRYLPWVSGACLDGVADVVFEDGARVAVRATDFLRDARATLLARYVESRSERLAAVLERAGILPFFADHVALAGSIADLRDPPRPALNGQFPPARPRRGDRRRLLHAPPLRPHRRARRVQPADLGSRPPRPVARVWARRRGRPRARLRGGVRRRHSLPHRTPRRRAAASRPCRDGSHARRAGRRRRHPRARRGWGRGDRVRGRARSREARLGVPVRLRRAVRGGERGHPPVSESRDAGARR